jgi:hypothetical protein
MSPTSLAQLQAAQLTAPGVNQLEADRYNTITRNQAATDADILGTIGRDRASIASEIDRGINPEFYQAREAGLDSILGQLKMLDLNNANPEAERLVNLENVRTGNLTTPSNETNTVKNALQFGDERLKRSAALSQALNTANNFLTSSRATFDPFGRSVTTSTTNNAVGSPSAFGSNSQTSNLGNDLLGNVFGTFNNAIGINAQRRDSLDRFNETMGSLPSYS